MMHKRKMSVLFSAMAFVVVGITIVQVTPVQDRNLQILPKDISDEKLDSIMHSYNKALGVKCEFCHVKSILHKDSLDYASDKEPMKEEARKMMRMTIKINTENFYFDKNQKPQYLNTVRCMTCHQGEAFPPED